MGNKHIAVVNGTPIDGYSLIWDSIDGYWAAAPSTPALGLVNVKNFGAIGDGVTDDTAAVQIAINNLNLLGNVLFFPSGDYVLSDTIGPFPFGTIIRGVGVGGFDNTKGSRLLFTNAGVGIQIGYSDSTNSRDGAIIEGLEILGWLDTGYGDYPNINEIGIDILGNAQITIRDCRMGGFKYQISIDGGEGIWIQRIQFDGGIEGHGYQDMITDYELDSACAIRIGSFNFTAIDTANGIWIEDIQFNNSRWGIWHQDGAGHHVRGCNYELAGGCAIVQGCTGVSYEKCIGEAARIASFWFMADAPTTCTNFAIRDCWLSQSAPLIRLDNVALYAPDIKGNYLSAMKRHAMVGTPDLTFTDNGGTGDTIVRSTGSFITDGFRIGDIITVADSVSNNITGAIADLTADTITLGSTALTNEGPTSGCSIIAPFAPIVGTSHIVGPVSHGANMLPIEGSYIGVLCDSGYTSTINGTPINHAELPQAALDVHIFSYSYPGLRISSGASYIYHEVDAASTTLGGTRQTYDQVYSGLTGLPGSRKTESQGWAYVATAAAASNQGLLKLPSNGAGLVTMSVVAIRDDDTTKVGFWEIKHLVRNDGGPVTLLGTPIESETVDLDGSFVAPEIVTDGTYIYAYITGHPAHGSMWSIQFSMNFAGR